MTKCPECKEELEYLHYQEYQVHYGSFGIDKDNQSWYDDMYNGDEYVNPQWSCPECDKVLFTKEDDAVKFLNGE